MIVTLFQSVSKAYTRPEWIVDGDWPTIAEFLTTFNQCESKEDMQLFNLWQFDMAGEPGRRRIYENNIATENYEEVAGTIRRCKSNAKVCWGLVLDYDGEERIDRVIETLDGFSYLLYTTFRHTEETHKFRVVLPFTKPIGLVEFQRKKEAISKTFPKVDLASFSESQSFYLHSAASQETAIAFWTTGEFLDLDLFPDTIIKPRTELLCKTDLNTAGDVEQVLSALKKHYPIPDYRTWLSIMFATANEIGDGPAVALLQQYWPEQKDGEYRAKITTRSRERGPTMGTLYYLVRLHEPNFKAEKNRPKTSQELKDFIIKKYGTGVK